jgi:hypothetical protein
MHLHTVPLIHTQGVEVTLQSFLISALYEASGQVLHSRDGLYMKAQRIWNPVFHTAKALKDVSPVKT